MSVDAIFTRLLKSINDKYDKKDSYISDILKAVAIEFSAQEDQPEKILNKSFVDTSYDEYLDRKVMEQGIIRKPATYATGKVKIIGQEGATINKGDLVASDLLNYEITEDATIDSTNFVNVNCQAMKSGNIGNCPVGAIKYFPITIPGLSNVTNEETFVNGYEAETDEELRKRYIEKVRTPPSSGNKYHYRNWAKEVPGVGEANVFPLWAGNGTVKVAIIDVEGKGARRELLDEVYNYIEENRPIGAAVTVVSALEVPINISVKIIFVENNFTIQEIIENIKKSIKEYLKEIAFKKDSPQIVSYAQIGSLILGTDGILDYENLFINGDIKNIEVSKEQVAVLGDLTITE